MTPEQFNSRMKSICDREELGQLKTDKAHEQADELLVTLIDEKLPEFADGLRSFEKLYKWYA